MNCPHCGADMTFSPCCGRVDGLTAEVQRLRAEVADRERTEARILRHWKEDQEAKQAEIGRLRAELAGERDVLKACADVAEQAEARLSEVVRICEQEAPAKGRAHVPMLSMLTVKHRLAARVLAAAQPEQHQPRSGKVEAEGLLKLAAAQPELWLCARCGYQNSGPICTHCAEPHVRAAAEPEEKSRG